MTQDYFICFSSTWKSNMKVAVLQPNFFPFKSYYDLVEKVDKVIFLDDVAYNNKSWANKTILNVNSKDFYFRVPVNNDEEKSRAVNNGKKKTAEWAKGLVNNMARKPKGNDRAQILAVAAGEADYAVANTYYIALMLSGKKGPEQQAAAKKIKPFFPNQDGRGTHMNISGGGVLKYAPNKGNAIKLLEFLLTKEAQEHIVNNTFEYPMIEGIKPNKLIAQFGLGFKQDLKTKVSKYGKNQADALKIMTEAGWE